MFGYEYLSGSNLLHKLTKPNGMTLTQSYEEHRDLLTGMSYHRGTTLVAQREYVYDNLGRPTARNTARKGTVVNDTFAHNTRSELTAAQVNGENYQYNYDNIGNRTTATEGDESTTYTANALNQYTSIQENEEAAFTPLFDADGNQTRIKTETGIWEVIYNAENRPVSFTNAESNTVVECAYDSMGRRAYKKVMVEGAVTLHMRYIYRGYLQIAALDLTRSIHPALWFITWDPTQPIATRPLSIRINGTWYTYGWDLTKNICELYSTGGNIATSYTYTPFGKVTSSGNVTQPIQWSSEFHDTELGLVYYNYRYYNQNCGCWLCKDLMGEKSGYNLYYIVDNKPLNNTDIIGMSFELFDERQYAYNHTSKERIKIEASHWTQIMGALLYNFYLGNGEIVSFDLKHLNVEGSTYQSNAKWFISRGFYNMKELNLYNVIKYTKPERYKGNKIENYLLGDYSMSASYLLKQDPKKECAYDYEATIYIEDRFNADHRKNEDNDYAIIVRNIGAFFLDLLPNTPLLVDCEKTYKFRFECGNFDFSINN